MIEPRQKILDGDKNMPTSYTINIGDKFGKLTTISRCGSNRYGHLWLCLCECGRETIAVSARLHCGGKKSCGCLKTTHRMTNSPEFRAWTDMQRRCYDPKNSSFAHYGGRGITVASEWRGENGFIAFFQYVGLRPSSRHSLDRYPNKNGNYEPGNVRWATIEEQNQNKRDNVYLTLRDETMVVNQWAKRLGIRADTLYRRVKNQWTDEEVLTIPLRGRRHHG